LRRKDYPDGKFTLAFVGYGDESEHAVIELTHNWDTKSYDLGNGFGHIAVAVPDAYKACEAVKARGGKVTREAGPMKFGGSVIAFVEDPTATRSNSSRRAEAVGERTNSMTDSVSPRRCGIDARPREGRVVGDLAKRVAQRLAPLGKRGADEPWKEHLVSRLSVAPVPTASCARRRNRLSAVG
jgi:catechol 2,3-dioxygenase-like lactoylglutathione lyase family enzyme